MKLGKRYIAIVKHPTMPHWDDYPAPILYKNAQAAALVAVNSTERVCGCDHEHRVRVVEVDVDDLPAADPPLDDQHQHAERLATKWLARYQELCELTGTVPRDPPKWTCVVCGQTHPADHAGLFCGICKIMAACCSCERTFKGQCHTMAASVDVELSLADRDVLLEMRGEIDCSNRGARWAAVLDKLLARLGGGM